MSVGIETRTGYTIDLHDSLGSVLTAYSEGGFLRRWLMPLQILAGLYRCSKTP